MKGWEKKFQTNNNQKETGVAILILQRRNYILIKDAMYQEDKIIINICTSINRTSKYVNKKSTELKQEINSSLIIFGHFYTSPLTVYPKTDRS